MTSLNIEKLNKLLIDNGIVPEKHFSYKHRLIFVECIILSSGTKFFLDIPNEYKISIVNGKHYPLQPISITENDDQVISQFAKPFNDLDVLTNYRNEENQFQEEFIENNISEQLKQTYKYSINIKDVENEEQNDVRDITRQLDRLSFSVLQTNYKICITYKNFFVILRNSNHHIFHCPTMTNYNDQRDMMISINLITFYSKIDKIDSEINLIKSSVEKILEMNYEKNVKSINFLIHKTQSIVSKFQELHLESLKLRKLNEKTLNLLKFTNMTEREQYERRKITGKSEEVSTEVQKIKNELITNIIKIDERKSNILLTVDKILFDNIVMMNSIVKNFEMLLN